MLVVIELYSFTLDKKTPTNTHSVQSPGYNVSGLGFCKPQIRPSLTFAPNLAYHIHIICLLINGGGGDGGVGASRGSSHTAG